MKTIKSKINAIDDTITERHFYKINVNRYLYLVVYNTFMPGSKFFRIEWSKCLKMFSAHEKN